MKAKCVWWVAIFVLSLFAGAAQAKFKIDRAGTLVAGDARIPAYVISVDNPNGDGWFTPQWSRNDLNVPRKVSAEAADSLAAYMTNVGWLLVPRGWIISKAAVGVDGSSVYAFKQIVGPGMFSAYDSSACVGCALSEVAPFFPEAKREAMQGGFPGNNDPRDDGSIHSVKLGKHTVAYRRGRTSAQPIDGIAYYNPDDDEHVAITCEVSLPESEHSLATAILNWRLPPKSKR